MSNLLGKVSNLANDVRLYWKKPPIGRYMPYREIAAYSFGGIGAYFLIYIVQQLSLSVNNFIIGNAIGINPEVMYVIYILSVISGFPSTAIRANIIDNTRNREGKYRPYLITMAIPTALLAIGFVMVPYEKIESQWMKAGIVLLFNIGFQFFYMFFYDAYENLIHVLSPNTQERTDVAAVKSVIYSFAPTVANAIMPLAAKALTNNSMTDMKLYRFVYPPMAIIGILVSVIIYANTQEKIVQAKTHVVRIKFLDALRAVAKNKYFWIISFAGWLGFLEGFYGVILQWLYQYRHACTPGQYSIVTLLYGNGSLWGMIFAPMAIRKYGKKKVLIFTNFMNIIFIAAMYPIIVGAPTEIVIWLILFCLYMNAIVGAFSHVLNPSIQADIRDYQQYVTGERIDGMFATVGLIGSVITMATGGVLPIVYKQYGINDATLASLKNTILAQETDLAQKVAKGEVALSNYDVLYIEDIFNKLMLMLILLSVVGAAMNLVPYFFYDLTENQQKAMVRVLRIRALFEDYGNGVLKDKDLVEAIDIIREAESYQNLQPLDLKAEKAKMKKQLALAKNKAEKKAAKKTYRDAVDFNNNIEIAGIVMRELNKFSDENVQKEVMLAQQIYDAGLAGLTHVDESILEQAKAIEDKTLRKKAVEKAKERLACKKIILKEYNGQLKEFDTSVFEELFNLSDKNEDAITEAYKKLHAAKRADRAQEVETLKAEIKKLKAEKKDIDARIKKATDENSLYARAAKPYTDAKKLLAAKVNYAKFEEIAEHYEEAKAKAEEADRLKAEEEARIEAEKKAYAEKVKAEKKAAKLAKKEGKKDKKDK